MTIEIYRKSQMKLDKDSFLANMNMIELDRKKILFRPSQAESTKGNDVVIGEERSLRLIKQKSPKDDQWQKNEGSKPQRCSNAIFDILMTKYKLGRSGIRGAKTGPSIIPNRAVRFPWVKLVLLQLGVHPANDLGLRRSKI
jgi:hypothetical protein